MGGYFNKPLLIALNSRIIHNYHALCLILRKMHLTLNKSKKKTSNPLTASNRQLAECCILGLSAGPQFLSKCITIYVTGLSLSIAKLQEDMCNSKGCHQPAHLYSLISLYSVRLKKFWVLDYPKSAKFCCARLGVFLVHSCGTIMILLK